MDNVVRLVPARDGGDMTALDDYRAAVPPHLDRWALVDPARLLRDLRQRMPLTAGQSVLCQVERPATDQLLVAHTVVWRGRGPADEMEARDDVEEAMRGIGHRDWVWDDDVRLSSSVVVVVIRDGRAVTRSSDFHLAYALRYANNPFQALLGDLIVVTPHGWIAVCDDVAGLEPTSTPEP